MNGDKIPGQTADKTEVGKNLELQENGISNNGFQLPPGDEGKPGASETMHTVYESVEKQMYYRVGDNIRPDLAALYGLQVSFSCLAFLVFGVKYITYIGRVYWQYI